MSASDSLSDIFVAEASHAEDILDESSGVARSIDQRISQADDARMQAAREKMRSAAAAPSEPLQQPAVVASPVDTTPPGPVQQQTTPIDDSADQAEISTTIDYNPYPKAMHQHVVSPTGTSEPLKVTTPESVPPQKQPSSDTVSPDIMRLANNNDLSISALSREAHRLENNEDEVVVSLR